MRKMSILFLAVVLIIGMSVGVMATPVNVPVSFTTAPYAAVYLVTDLFAVNGLFGDSPLDGQPGLYVSDGLATVNYVTDYVTTGANAWGISSSILGSSHMDIDENNVEVFMVDTNTDATVTLSWDSSSNWPDSGLHALVRTSTHEDIPTPNHGYATEFDSANPSNLREHLASIAQGIGSNWSDNDNGAQVHFDGDTDSFGVQASQCQGPYLYHLNGALFLEKSDAIMAGDNVGFTLELTVAE